MVTQAERSSPPFRTIGNVNALINPGRRISR
jgi:hypothetical protein